MKNLLTFAFFLALMGCATTNTTTKTIISPSSELVKPNTNKKHKLSPDAFVDGLPMLHFKNYHDTVNKNGRTYVLDSYVIPLEQPFYIHLRTMDKLPIALDDASKIASDYIKPKGCTEPLVRKPDLDKSNSNKDEWIIGISC